VSTVTTYQALLSGESWNGEDIHSHPVFLTYSFEAGPATGLPPEYSNQFLGSFRPFSPTEQATAREALQAWADVSGITLFEAPAGQGDIRFGSYNFDLADAETKALAGFAFGPTVYAFEEGELEDALGGDVFINYGFADFGTLAHEIGHALGLKHPFEGEFTLDPLVDNLRHTVMTYNPLGGPATALGTLDIDAIQYLYGGPGSDGAQVDNWSWDAAQYVLTQNGNLLDDFIAGVGAADRVSGGEGADYVFTRGGSDVVAGDGGADTIAGGLDADTLRGGIGDDLIQGDEGDDLLQGGDGNDVVSGLDGADRVFGDAGDDTLYGGSGVNELSGGSGDDTLVITLGPAQVDGGEGFDRIWMMATSATPVSYSYASFSATGSSYSSIESVGLAGDVGADTLQGGDLPDWVFGGDGADSLAGGAEADALFGEAGADTVTAGVGDDTISEDSGRNYLRGEEGDDSITGGTDFDDINGNMGRDTASGGLGDDWVVGGKDADSLFGEVGEDIVYGNIGNDTCEGGEGADIVRGGQDGDIVLGGAGNDFVSGDRGDDTVTGGGGADNFHTFGEAGIDRVTDFNLAEGDRVMLDPGTTYTVAQVGSDTVISMTAGGQMILVGVAMSSLTGNWIFGA
jgi:Ca2+-binding RTX toxin-like protein